MLPPRLVSIAERHREYKSPGREPSSEVGFRLTERISVGGGYRVQSRAKPEEVTAAVSNRNKTSALAADASAGITLGILFAAAVELCKGEKEDAKKMAGEIPAQIEAQYAASCK